MNQSVPTIYRMLEEICEENETVLVKVKIYESGAALRANLYFTGKERNGIKKLSGFGCNSACSILQDTNFG